jgi:hypothetical protein
MRKPVLLGGLADRTDAQLIATAPRPKSSGRRLLLATRRRRSRAQLRFGGAGGIPLVAIKIALQPERDAGRSGRPQRRDATTWRCTRNDDAIVADLLTEVRCIAGGPLSNDRRRLLGQWPSGLAGSAVIERFRSRSHRRGLRLLSLGAALTDANGLSSTLRTNSADASQYSRLASRLLKERGAWTCLMVQRYKLRRSIA